MIPIRPTGASPFLASSRTPRGAGTAGQFGLAAPTGDTERTAATAGASPVAASLLALQAAGGSALRDAEAGRRADQLLEELGRLQRGLLGGAEDAAGLARLAQLGRGEDGDDPSLRDVVRAIATRAAVELARRERRSFASTV